MNIQVAVKKKDVFLDKPIQIGFSVLEVNILTKDDR